MLMRRDPRFAAVLVIATEAFARDHRIWPHIDPACQHIDFGPILATGTFTTTERLLLETAATLWTSAEQPTMLGVIADRLGDEWLPLVVRALAAARGADLTTASGRGSMWRH
jgi:hypothetical protein